jgi:hypothetical protein
MKKYRRVTDVLLCKNKGMIASVAFDLHAVFKCEKIQQIMQMYTPSSTYIAFDMESPIFYYAKISARCGCFIVQKQWYDRIRCF